MNNELNDGKVGENDLDELLSMCGKPFADWKEEREYLRRKWGEQGKRICPDSIPGHSQGADESCSDSSEDCS